MARLWRPQAVAGRCMVLKQGSSSLSVLKTEAGVGFASQKRGMPLASVEPEEGCCCGLWRWAPASWLSCGEAAPGGANILFPAVNVSFSELLRGVA